MPKSIYLTPSLRWRWNKWIFLGGGLLFCIIVFYFYTSGHLPEFDLFPSATVGVSVGDSWRYDIQASGFPNPPPYTYYIYDVTSISGTTVQVWEHDYFPNGTEDIHPFPKTEYLYLSDPFPDQPFSKTVLIRSNANIGEVVVSNTYLVSGGTITQQINKSYWGQVRAIYVASATIQIGSGYPEYYTFYFDKLTGIMCEEHYQIGTLGLIYALTQYHPSSSPPNDVPVISDVQINPSSGIQPFQNVEVSTVISDQDSIASVTLTSSNPNHISEPMYLVSGRYTATLSGSTQGYVQFTITATDILGNTASKNGGFDVIPEFLSIDLILLFMFASASVLALLKIRRHEPSSHFELHKPNP